MDERYLKQSKIYLLLVYAVCFGLGIAALFTQNANGNPVFDFLQKGFAAVPVLVVLAVRRITKDKAPWNLSLRVWKRPGLWAFCAFAPGILIVLGTAVYFALFPKNYSGVFNYGALAALTGASGGGTMTVTTPVIF